MVDRDEDSMFWLPFKKRAELTMLVIVSDLQDKEAEETEQKIINEGQMRLPPKQEDVLILC
jgi:hypothetical protein